VNDPTETIATFDTNLARVSVRHWQRICWMRRLEAERAMRPVALVVATKRVRTCSRCGSFRISSQSRHSERIVRTKRSATPFACGVRNGVRTISHPTLRNTSSKLSVNFWSRWRIK